MPSNIVKTPEDERLWKQAKQLAADEDHVDDWAYINGVYQRLKHHTGGKRMQKAIAFPVRQGRNIAPTRAVYDYLRENYPANVLEWVKGETWERKRIPLSKIRMARRPGGRNMDKVRGITEAIAENKPMDPVVLVETADGYKIADGYHRTLAFKHAGKKSIEAYVAVGEHDKGDWDSAMHDAKLNKSLSDADIASKELLESLASIEHEQWMEWSKSVASEVSAERRDRWEKYWIPYDQLSDEVKEQDREWARKALNLMRGGSIEKSWGDAGFAPIPNAQHIGQRANHDLLREAANTTSDAHVTPYTVYRRVMGEHAQDAVDVAAIKTNTEGTWYRVSDGKRSMQVYQPRNGPARLVKAMTTYTPAANIVWTALRQAGYTGKPKDGKATFDGCTVEVVKNNVRLSGRNTQAVFRIILDALQHKQTSEAWVDGHQQFGTPQMGVAPW